VSKFLARQLVQTGDFPLYSERFALGEPSMSWLKRQLNTLPTLLVGGGIAASFLFLCWKATAIDRASMAAEVGGVSSSGNPSPFNAEKSPSGDDGSMGELSPKTVQAGTIPSDSPKTAAPTNAVVVVNHAGVLNAARQFALGMIETGNNDSAIGGLGEVSRFQIMPSVWKQYSSSRSYRNLDVSSEVARQHWLSLYAYFKQRTDRDPTDFDMYVLWNTRYGYYARKGFSPTRLSPIVRDRAQRFANLVEDHARSEPTLELASAAR